MCMNFMEHQSIDLVFKVVPNVVRVLPGRSVKNALHSKPPHGCKMMSLFLFVSLFVLLSFSLSRDFVNVTNSVTYTLVVLNLNLFA